MILMLPNTSGAWAGTGVWDSKVAGGVSLLYFLLFNIYSSTDDTDVSSFFCIVLLQQLLRVHFKCKFQFPTPCP